MGGMDVLTNREIRDIALRQSAWDCNCQPEDFLRAENMICPTGLGPNAKKVINPIGIHSSKINDPTSCPEDIKQEVMDFISTYIY